MRRTDLVSKSMTIDRPFPSDPDSDVPRVGPADRESMSEATRELLGVTTRPDGTVPATVAVLTHRPALLGPFLAWAAAPALGGALSPRDHELLALRTVARCESSFEWDEHVVFARRAGISDTEIAAVASPDAPGPWSPTDAALIRAADELTEDRTIAQSTWAEPADAYGDAELAEIPFVVGQCTMLSMVANALHL